MQKMVSIVIPVYNAAPYLRACLDSLVVAAQAAGPVELICVDDGSTDGSGKLLDAYVREVESRASAAAAGWPRFKLVHQANAGVSAARNAGMALATGELVTFMDADDTFVPSALQTLVKVWRESGAEVIRYGCNLVRRHSEDATGPVSAAYSELKLDEQSVTPIRHCNLGVATAISARLARIVRWPELTHCEDPLFVLRCLSRSHKSVRLEDHIYNYLLREGSAAHSVSLSIVTATCRYLVAAYDECAGFPGFTRFRLDTCRYLAGFLTGPLAGCGRDVQPAERTAAEAAVTEARTALVKRDPLFAALTDGGRFDVVFSLGSACSSTEVLRAAGLQYASFPFDWLLGPGPAARVELLVREFAGWLVEPGDFEAIPNPGAFRHGSWRDRRTGFCHFHDFEQSVPLAAQLPAVREKYVRRGTRLLELVRRARRVLVVWTGDPRDRERIAEAELSQCLNRLREKFPQVEFRLLVFECVADVSATDPEVKIAAGVSRIAFDYRLPAAGNDWAIRRELLLPFLTHYSVADYRTRELRRTHAAAARRRDRERFPARTTVGYWLLKLEFKLYKHLKKALTRRGVWME